MSKWKVVLLVVLAFTMGVGGGYLGWGTAADRSDRQIQSLREELGRLNRQLDARNAGADAGQQRWSGRGVVRAVYPQLLMITHDEIAGLQPARTTGFRVAGDIQAEIGSAVRFWIEGTAAHNAALVSLEKW